MSIETIRKYVEQVNKEGVREEVRLAPEVQKEIARTLSNILEDARVQDGRIKINSK